MDDLIVLLDHAYRIERRTISGSQDYPPGLTERMAIFPGKYIIYDPYDDADGFCIVGDDLQLLMREAVQQIED